MKRRRIKSLLLDPCRVYLLNQSAISGFSFVWRGREPAPRHRARRAASGSTKASLVRPSGVRGPARARMRACSDRFGLLCRGPSQKFSDPRGFTLTFCEQHAGGRSVYIPLRRFADTPYGSLEAKTFRSRRHYAGMSRGRAEGKKSRSSAILLGRTDISCMDRYGG